MTMMPPTSLEPVGISLKHNHTHATPTAFQRGDQRILGGGDQPAANDQKLSATAESVISRLPCACRTIAPPVVGRARR
jgi:hypothetical protein